MTITETTMTKRPPFNTDKLYDHIIDTMIEDMDYRTATIDEEYDIDDSYSLFIYVKANMDCDFACENDYFNGTGYTYVTRAETRVTSLEIDLFNKKTNEYEELHGAIDFGYLKREIEEQLTEAAYE